MAKKTYSQLLVLQLVGQVEALALCNESLQNQLDKVDAVFVGTRFNWQGTGRGRIETLEQLIKEAANVLP
ncbi:hypothetical protein LCGC14_1245680 [marine sediment metagenome]|uniref:Uncharacterized protein n=1 Tax=marine sediment metagenome TaxID=412755 RepID=A0A0F9LRH3_9ZZZZ